jgi:cyclic pyranopterin phosphate synthase
VPREGLAGLTHLDAEGRARMVDVTPKPETARQARARARVRVRPATLAAIRAGTVAKGDVLAVARLAGIMAAKRTADWIPLCHPLRLTAIEVELDLDRRRSTVEIETRVATVDKTGVEMEALTAAAAAALALYDMVKAIDRGIRVTDLCLLEKAGGRSGRWVRPGGSGRRALDRRSGTR